MVKPVKFTKKLGGKTALAGDLRCLNGKPHGGGGRGKNTLFSDNPVRYVYIYIIYYVY
jgi:hypothetical protein